MKKMEISKMMVITFQSLVMTSNSALIVLGGCTSVDITNEKESPVVSKFEAYGCSQSSLPDFPQSVVGASMTWMKTEDQDSLLVCGGANWSQTFHSCHIFAPK